MDELPKRTSRTGRKPGAKNKRTLVREALMRASQTAREADGTGYIAPPENDDKATMVAIANLKGTDFIMESLNALGEALGVYLTVARRESNIEKRLVLYANVSVIAQKLAPFTFPTLASVHTTTKQQSALERVGSVEQEVYDEFMAEIAEKGELPRQVKAYISGPKNGNGSGGGNNGNGGVANR